jgi:hypothetical protein
VAALCLKDMVENPRMATADLLQLLPKYHQIKETLRSELARLHPESRLPTVRTLRDRFQASQATLDRALRELEKEGLIRREHGRGLFVCGAAPCARSVRLKLSSGLTPLDERLATQAILRFEQGHPHTKVLVQVGPAAQADVRQVDTMSILDGAPHLIPLDDLLPAGFLQRFHPHALAPFQSGGATFALPRLFSSWVLYYNREPFDRAGLPYPDADWTWKELLQAARRLTRPSEGRYGFLAIHNFRGRLPYIWQNGGELFDAVSGDCRLAADDVVEALEFWRELEQSSPIERETADLNELFGRFLSGHLAMIPWGGGLRAAARADPRCRWGVAPLPAGRCRATLLVGEAYGVSRETADVEAALGLAQALVSPESMGEQIAVGYPLAADGTMLAQCPVESVFETSLEWARVSREYRFRDEMRLIDHEFNRAWRANADIAASCRRVQAIVSALIESRAARADHRELY